MVHPSPSNFFATHRFWFVSQKKPIEHSDVTSQAVHTFMLQKPLLQSPAFMHASVLSQGEQLPPQSLSVSSPSFIPFAHVAGTQCPSILQSGADAGQSLGSMHPM